MWLGEEAAKWGQSVGWRWLGRRQLHGDGPIAQRGGPLRCWEGRVLGAVEHRALAVPTAELVVLGAPCPPLHRRTSSSSRPRPSD